MAVFTYEITSKFLSQKSSLHINHCYVASSNLFIILNILCIAIPFISCFKSKINFSGVCVCNTASRGTLGYNSAFLQYSYSKQVRQKRQWDEKDTYNAFIIFMYDELLRRKLLKYALLKPAHFSSAVIATQWTPGNRKNKRWKWDDAVFIVQFKLFGRAQNSMWLAHSISVVGKKL